MWSNFDPRDKQKGKSLAIISIFSATFCLAQLKPVNIWLKRILDTLWPSFAQQNIFDKLNIFLRYHRIKVQKWWNSAFHHWRALIWRYFKNLFRLSKIFCWSKLDQSIQMNCPIFLLIRCLLVLAVQCARQNVAAVMDTFRENCPF